MNDRAEDDDARGRIGSDPSGQTDEAKADEGSASEVNASEVNASEVNASEVNASEVNASDPARTGVEASRARWRVAWDGLVAFFAGARAQSALVWSSRVILLSVLASYVVSWATANQGMLFDPDLQNDDARTTLFPFHQYGSQGTLGDDPIAQEMLSAVPWGVRLLYMTFVPVVDVYWASKLVQLVALGILLWAGIVLARSSRTGLAAGAFLVFLVLHTTFAVDRLGGGLPRAFGFPCFALWLAGVLGQKRIPRFLAPVILALTYPSIMNLVLAAEGLYVLRGMFRIRWAVLGRRLKRYAALVGVCMICVMPAALGDSDRGPIHTLEEAKKEPAFGRSGRLWILPFAKPIDAMSDAFFEPVSPRGRTPLLEVESYREEREMIAVLVVAMFLLIPTLRISSGLTIAGAFFVGTAIIYALSRAFAFLLYSPERYYSFGMRMACIALLLACVAHVWFWWKPPVRIWSRNFLASLLIGGLWLGIGDGLEKDAGIEISRKTDKPLYDFIRTLPKDARFAAHILDGDGIPYWGARSHTGSFETLQPWFVDSWARQKERTNATLGALYASDEDTILAFAERYGVTHFLVNRSRYRRDLDRQARSFQPFSSEVGRIIGRKKSKQMVLAKVPKSAVVFEHGRFSVVSVEKLRSAHSGK